MRKRPHVAHVIGLAALVAAGLLVPVDPAAAQIVARPTPTPRSVIARPTSTPTPRPRDTVRNPPARATATPELPVAIPSFTPTPRPLVAKPTVTPTPTLFPFDPEPWSVPVASGNIVPLKIDLIQSVSQDPFSDEPWMPLVAHKTALVRVWVLGGGADDKQITVTLSANHNGNAQGDCGPGTTSATKSIDNALNDWNLESWTRNNLSRTINFALPADCDWLNSGYLMLTATTHGPECTECLDDNTISAIFSIHDVRAPKVKMTLVEYYFPGSPNDGKAPAFTLDGFDTLIDSYPIADVEVVDIGAWSTTPSEGLNAISLEPGPDKEHWLENYIAMRDWFIANNSSIEDTFDSNMGLFHPDVLASAGVVGACTGVAGGHVFLSAAGCGGTYAHEMGHNFGLPHASNAHGECDGGSCDPEWPFAHGRRHGFGWVPTDPNKLIVPDFSDGAHSHDLMSYGGCSGHAYTDDLATYCRTWLSTVNYGRIGQRLWCLDTQWNIDWSDSVTAACLSEWGPFTEVMTPPTSTPTPPDDGPGPFGPTDKTGATSQHAHADGSVHTHPDRPVWLEAASLPTFGDAVKVSGALLSNGSVDLWPAYVRSAAERPQASPGNAGNYAIVLFDQSGNELRRHRFEPEPTSVHAAIVHSTFDQTVAWDPRTQRIAVVRGDAVLAERSLSATAPEIRLLSPNGGERWPSQGDVQLSWQANDADGDALRYAVEYSPDRRRTWETLATNLSRTSHTIHAWEAPGSREALVRVRATDGLRTSLDASDSTFEVATKPPVVDILGLPETSTALAGQPLVLRGMAIDPDGGTLRGDSLTWTSNRAGVLGTGQSVTARLSAGDHTITLTATDRHGEQSSTTVHIVVA